MFLHTFYTYLDYTELKAVSYAHNYYNIILILGALCIRPGSSCALVAVSSQHHVLWSCVAAPVPLDEGRWKTQTNSSSHDYCRLHSTTDFSASLSLGGRVWNQRGVELQLCSPQQLGNSLFCLYSSTDL